MGFGLKFYSMKKDTYFTKSKFHVPSSFSQILAICLCHFLAAKKWPKSPDPQFFLSTGSFFHWFEMKRQRNFLLPCAPNTNWISLVPRELSHFLNCLQTSTKPKSQKRSPVQTLSFGDRYHKIIKLQYP